MTIKDGNDCSFINLQHTGETTSDPNHVEVQILSLATISLTDEECAHILPCKA